LIKEERGGSYSNAMDGKIYQAVYHLDTDQIQAFNP
jgi:hypothetical protein